MLDPCPVWSRSSSASAAALSLETPCLCDLRPQAGSRQAGASVLSGFYPRRPAFCLCVPACPGSCHAGPGLGAGQLLDHTWLCAHRIADTRVSRASGFSSV